MSEEDWLESTLPEFELNGPYDSVRTTPPPIAPLILHLYGSNCIQTRDTQQVFYCENFLQLAAASLRNLLEAAVKKYEKLYEC